MFTRRARVRRATLLAVIPAATLVALVATACGTVRAPASGAATATTRPSAPRASTTPSAPGSVVSRKPVPIVPDPGPGPVVPVKTACTGWPSAPEATLPASFVPVKVLRCVTGYTTIPGKGQWLTATLEKADASLSPLADALRASSVRMRPGQMCPQFVMLPPEIVLVAADGTTIRPRFPVTNCGQIQHQVLGALDELQWQAVSQR
ncbi:MAG TPA: hypothetical protein VE441_15895, partial [Mycobacterium sp.]|nr:hypothetical protein [Mycobacterium sp.]